MDIDPHQSTLAKHETQAKAADQSPNAVPSTRRHPTEFEQIIQMILFAEDELR